MEVSFDDRVSLDHVSLALEPLWPHLASSAKSVLRLTSTALRRMVDDRLRRILGSEAQVPMLETAGGGEGEKN